MRDVTRVGVVGCGANAENHLRVYRRDRRAQLVGVFDRDPAAARWMAQRYRTETFGSLEQLLDAGLDLVDIVTPTPSHASLAIRALEAGHHVLVEKPMAVTSAECERMIQAAASSGKVLNVVHNKRFFQAMQSAKRYLVEHEATPTRMRYSHYLDRPARAWMPTRSGGILWEGMVHLVYLTQYLMGRVERVSAMARRVTGPVYDSVTVLLETETGVSLCEYDRNPKEPLQAFQMLTGDGTRLEAEVMYDVLRVRGHGGLPMTRRALRSLADDLLYPLVKRRQLLANLVRRGPTRLALPYEGTFATLIGGLLGYLAGEVDTPPVPAAEGLATIRVLEAMLESIESGRSVALPPSPGQPLSEA